MITPFLAGLNWDEAPECMDFSLTYGELLGQVADAVAALRRAQKPHRGATEKATKEATKGAAERAALLYARAPGIVNVMLNYKICVEHDLPLHPTVYYELKEARRYRVAHSLPEIEQANRLYRKSIDVARAAYRLDPDFDAILGHFRAEIPQAVLKFVFSGARDKYTWRGSQPELLERLASKLREEWAPDLIVAAAHGSIASGLLLAEIMRTQVYFIRFSMFKRSDEEPIVTFSDQAWLYDYKDKKVLLFDEDVAGGRTLGLFSSALKPLFSDMRTGCSIRHAGSSFKPDFTARQWWD